MDGSKRKQSLINTNFAGGAIAVIGDPQLGPLTNNGGPTETMPITMISLAYGNGDAGAPGIPSIDQRGLPRTVSGRLDLGAFELQKVLTDPRPRTWGRVLVS